MPVEQCRHKRGEQPTAGPHSRLRGGYAQVVAKLTVQAPDRSVDTLAQHRRRLTKLSSVGRRRRSSRQRGAVLMLALTRPINPHENMRENKWKQAIFATCMTNPNSRQHQCIVNETADFDVTKEMCSLPITLPTLAARLDLSVGDIFGVLEKNLGLASCDRRLLW